MGSKMPKIPPGPTPVVDNGQVAVNAVLLVLGPVAVGARLWARKLKRQRLGWDDWTIIIALVLNTALCCHGIWAGAKHYVGYVIPFMKAHDRVEYKKTIYVDILMCHLIYGIIKVSVVLLYRRIFYISPRFNIVSTIYMGVVVAWIVSAFFGGVFAAGNPSDFWNSPSPQLSQVINFGAWLLSNSAIDIALDLVVLSMPIPMIRTLTMSWRRKLQIVGVFMLGAFCLVSSAVRMYYAYKVLYIITLTPYARTRASTLNSVWSHIEATFSIIAACLPTVIPVLARLRSAESLLGSARRFVNRSTSKLSLSKRSGSSKGTQDRSGVSGAASQEKSHASATGNGNGHGHGNGTETQGRQVWDDLELNEFQTEAETEAKDDKESVWDGSRGSDAGIVDRGHAAP